MNKELSPSLISRIGQKRILWFEPSNQYHILSDSVMSLVEAFLVSQSRTEFIYQLSYNPNVTEKEATDYYDEIEQLMTAANIKSKTEASESIAFLIPKQLLSIIYEFGNTIVEIHYGSETVMELVHPQWTHAQINSLKTPEVSFHIFKEGSDLVLLKNKNYIGHYPYKDYHLFQGQFAIEVLNALYSKEEADWIATFHASTICNEKEAVMLIGDSGNGKSTLSAILMAKGFDLLADDFTPLSAINRELYRFPSAISVKEGAFDTLEPMVPGLKHLPVYQSTSKAKRQKFIPTHSFTDTTNFHLPCTKIIFVEYTIDKESQFTEIGLEEMLPTLITQSWLSPLASNAKLFLDWLQHVQSYKLQYSDTDFAVSNINELLNS